ncbi:phosphatidylserine decarboxylase family protein [Natranaerobius trueperi]|uniref:Phosphatidylserine decarboxylase proenzyme n=1 Tax=Natranaerobius trueperi TaxID=759412 RepID=A0A226C2S5_9FIRM|nr:phosphatidylserine decarboxylase family protein [Natranaerobius trueperi]OWZ84690.1 phosphatidylserine decarboxylase family protein [Natranaerobius trueperi]
MRAFTISRHGFSTIGFFLLGAIVSWLFYFIELSIVFLALATFTAIFFRNPKRYPPKSDNLVVSPADGKVMDIETITEPNFTNQEMKRVRIFLSLLDVHINRMPLTGQVVNTKYYPGKYLVAWNDKASEENERNAIMINGRGVNYVVVQIAGFVARRIVSEAKTGTVLSIGDSFGMIKFGSCTELYLPQNTDVKVKSGDKVRAGETIMAVTKEEN